MRALGLFVSLLAPWALAGQSFEVRAAASYGEAVAPGAMAAGFGSGLAAETAVGATDRRGLLPRELGGVRVEVDGRAAGLLFVSAGQVNFVVPERTGVGLAEVMVWRDGGLAAAGVALVEPVAPGLFSRDGSGAGPGALSNSYTEAFAPFAADTLENPGCDKRTRLTVRASGIAGASEVALAIEDGAGGMVPVEDLAVLGADEELEGVDLLRFTLPAGLDMAGEVTLRLTADGVESNAVALALTEDESAVEDCVAGGRMLAFNTVEDLLAGDLWDVSSAAQVFAAVGDALGDTRGDWPLMGVGTTAEPGHNGEVIVWGTAAAPELVWSDPRFPLTVRTLTEEAIPFVGVAAGNPAEAMTMEAEAGRPIHAQVVEMAEERGISFAGVRVSGRFRDVSISVAHHLAKEGTPLTDPEADKAPYQLFFDIAGPVEWELSGVYATAAAVQEVASVKGAPLHLHGFQLDRAIAGHLGGAAVEGAVITLYPLEAPEVRDGDLAVGIVRAEETLDFEVINNGETTISWSTVQVVDAEGSVVYQAALGALAGGERAMVSAPMPDGAGDVLVVADPFNDVLERDESNNRAWVTVGVGR